MFLNQIGDLGRNQNELFTGWPIAASTICQPRTMHGIPDCQQNQLNPVSRLPRQHFERSGDSDHGHSTCVRIDAAPDRKRRDQRMLAFREAKDVFARLPHRRHVGDPGPGAADVGENKLHGAADAGVGAVARPEAVGS